MRAPRRRDDRGAAAVEFALVALILVTLVFGIIQFGIYFWAWQQTGHAAREASRFAAVYPNCTSQITTTGQDALVGAPVAGAAGVVRTGPDPAQIGDPVTVRVTATVIDIAFFDFFAPGIVKDATSRVENIPAGSDCP